MRPGQVDDQRQVPGRVGLLGQPAQGLAPREHAVGLGSVHRAQDLAQALVGGIGQRLEQRRHRQRAQVGIGLQQRRQRGHPLHPVALPAHVGAQVGEVQRSIPLARVPSLAALQVDGVQADPGAVVIVVARADRRPHRQGGDAPAEHQGDSAQQVAPARALVERLEALVPPARTQHVVGVQVGPADEFVLARWRAAGAHPVTSTAAERALTSVAPLDSRAYSPAARPATRYTPWLTTSPAALCRAWKKR